MLIIKPDGLRFSLTYWAQRCFMLPMVWFTYRVANDVHVEGLEHFDEVDGQTIILAPNHTSAWDSWVGTVWALSNRRRFVERSSYTCVLAAPENVPTTPLKMLTSALGAIPVDRERGIEQPALQDTLRLMRESRRQIVVTCYPEGTRSKDGRVRQKGKAGIGWLQHMTGAPVVPIYHCGAPRMPGIGMNLRLRVGKPLRLERWRDAPPEPGTWRGITEEIMGALHGLEADEDRRLGRAPPERKAARRGLARTSAEVAAQARTTETSSP